MTEDRSKLIWHSNSGWASTGYGSQTALFTPRLAERYDVAVSAFFGLEGAPLKLGEIKVLPGIANTYGNETIQGHAEHFFGNGVKGETHLRDGLVLTLMDVWVLEPRIWRTMNVCSWVPVDHDPVPPAVAQFFSQTNSVPIAMTRFGQERLAQFDALYVPHGVDTSVYQPRENARKVGGISENAFVVGVVAANKGNPSRKCFPEILQAFAVFRERHDDALLYLHTELQGVSQGVNLLRLIDELKIPSAAVLPCDQYRCQYDPLKPEVMSHVYSSFDVLLNPSAGEGFGLTVLEAQACGTPVIVTDFSAMKEVCGAGWKVEYEREWSAQMSWQARPSVEDILDALEKSYAMPGKGREALSRQAVDHAATYDADLVLKEHFLPALAEVQQRFDARAPVELKAAA